MTSLIVAVLLAAAPTSKDRVYTGDQTSNTVTVIDPGTNRTVGVLPLGAPRTEVLSPIYRGQALVHGLGFSPDHRTLVVVSIASNSVTFVDTATNKIRATAYVGRAPHEAFFTPDGSEVWVSVRGEAHVAVLDPDGKELRRIPVADGPGMVRFSRDGKLGFVVSSFSPEFDVVDVAKHEVVQRIPVASPFSPNLDVCSDGQVWMTHKDIGKVTVLAPGEGGYRVAALLDTGPITNHAACVDNSAGTFAFVTVGGADAVKVFTRDAAPKLVATIPTGSLPHGLWPSEDGSRVYVGLENADAVAVLDAVARRELVRIPGGQAPQALVFVSNAVPEGAGDQGLQPVGQRPVSVEMAPPGGGKAKGLASIRALGVVDGLEMTFLGLSPKTAYALYVGSSDRPPYKDLRHLADLMTNPRGGGAAQAVGPLRELVRPEARGGERDRFLVLLPAGEPGKQKPVLSGKVSAVAARASK
ncbi:MAG: beta-propeller fold lactonase family protein [Myxococcales bacterium]